MGVTRFRHAISNLITKDLHAATNTIFKQWSICNWQLPGKYSVIQKWQIERSKVYLRDESNRESKTTAILWFMTKFKHIHGMPNTNLPITPVADAIIKYHETHTISQHRLAVGTLLVMFIRIKHLTAPSQVYPFWTQGVQLFSPIT